MFLKCLKVGQLETNCYILCDKISNKAAVIDPGYDAGRIAAALADTGCEAEYILLTHGHWDHVGAVQELKKATGAKLVVFAQELDFLNDPARNLQRSFIGTPFEPFVPDQLIYDGEKLMLGMLELTFLHTPGHTAGSCCILCQDSIFTGDTLFRGDVGRTDLPTGSTQALVSSVKRLAALDGEYQVFPGHGDITTMSHERKYNEILASGDRTE